MMNVSSSRIFISLVLLGSLLWSCIAAAQSLPEGAHVNKDKCLGYEIEYKKYPRPVIAKIQADMYQIYHQDADWKHDAGLKGRPLHDGILGPITWSWMQRFCKNFALDTNANVVAAFPERAGEIAHFSSGFNEASATLISKKFAQWKVSHHHACDLDVEQVLAHGSDEELQALVRCYTGGEQKPELAQPVIVRTPAPPHTLYVLREDDFAAMAEASTSASLIGKAIISLQGKEFADKRAAQAEIKTLLADVPLAENKKASDILIEKVQRKIRYVISDQVLNTLNQQGISDALFNALKAMPEKSFEEREAFRKAVSAVINNVNSLPPVVDTTQHQTQESTGEKMPVVTSAPVNTERALLQIQLLSQQEYWVIGKLTAADIPVSHLPVAAPVIELLQDLQDREYPEGELLHLAIKNKILKASDICKQDKSNAVDKTLAKDNIAEIREYLQQMINPGNLTDKYCTENYYEKLDQYYDQHLRASIEKVYSEPMPAYTHETILWSGASKDCGCVPEEIQTMAYGIFPYWKTQDRPLSYDFSTFSRVAYFGLTVNNSGKLQQINSVGQNLLTDNSDRAKAFVREARRYGSKVDWVLEKEFDAAPELQNDAALQVFFSNLQTEIISWLALPLEDIDSRLRPWLSLGLAAQPLNGDGITLYFKNYPQTPVARQKFDDFFKSLKEQFRQFDETRNRWHVKKNISYLNIMLTTSSFLGEGTTFNREHLDSLTKADRWAEQNLSIVEIQDRVRSMVLLIMEDPYYTSLDEIYAVTTSTDRSVIAPLMFSDYSQMDRTTEHRGQTVDERKKRLAYVHESFGGGSFWPMVQFDNSSDGRDYKEFNNYIGKHFSPGYTESFWNETLCAYRWLLIYIMNVWLVLAFVYLVTMFYLFPHRCRGLPLLLRWLQHPLTVIALIFPPIMLWVYLSLVDSVFNLLNLSTLLCLVLLGLAIYAGVNAVKALQQQKPNRNLLQHQKMTAVPVRSKDNNIDESDENIDEDYK